jgi:hypothetical protein
MVGEKHVSRGDEVVPAIENADLGGHATIMSRALAAAGCGYTSRA